MTVRLHKSSLNFRFLELKAGEGYTQTYKHKSNDYELIGSSIQNCQYGTTLGEITLDLIFASLNDWEDFYNWVSDGSELELIRPKAPNAMVNVLSIGDCTSDFNQKIFNVSITFTFARQNIKNKKSGLDLGSKARFLSKLKDFNKRSSSFILNSRNRIRGFTVALTDMSSEIAKVGDTLGGASLLLTESISDIKNASSLIASGFNALSSGISKAIFAVTSLPSDVNAIYDEITGSISGVFKAFSMPNNKPAENELNMSSGLNIAYKVTQYDVSSTFIGNSVNNDKSAQNIETTNIIIKSALLLEVYDRFENLTNTLDVDLVKYKTKIDAVIDSIRNSKYIDSDFLYEVELLQSRFDSTYADLLLSSKKTLTFKIDDNDYYNIYQIAYMTNRNYDYVNDIIRINNISTPMFISSTVIVPYDG